jgi:NAD(P)-dependent dehydrogenase (short-subunit alcohol dehydrogenase family)
VHSSCCEDGFFYVLEGTEHLRLDGLKVVGLECDVSSEESVSKAFTRTFEAFGRVDVVVASAGESVRHLRLAIGNDIGVPRHC